MTGDPPRIEIGDVCPPIKSWFFPADKSLPPEELNPEKKEGEDESSAQSA